MLLLDRSREYMYDVKVEEERVTRNSARAFLAPVDFHPSSGVYPDSINHPFCFLVFSSLFNQRPYDTRAQLIYSNKNAQRQEEPCDQIFYDRGAHRNARAVIDMWLITNSVAIRARRNKSARLPRHARLFFAMKSTARNVPPTSPSLPPPPVSLPVVFLYSLQRNTLQRANIATILHPLARTLPLTPGAQCLCTFDGKQIEREIGLDFSGGVGARFQFLLLSARDFKATRCREPPRRYSVRLRRVSRTVPTLVIALSLARASPATALFRALRALA